MDPVAILESHLGYHETGVNDNIFSRDLGHPPEAWCADTVTDCYKLSGHLLPSMQPGLATGYASVWYGYTWAVKNGLAVPSHSARRNDAVCFGWEGKGIGGNPNEMHTALVVSAGPDGSLMIYVGGNQHDQVSQQTVTVGSDQIIGCIALSRFLGTDVPAHHPADGPHPSHHPKPTTHPNHHQAKLALPAWGAGWLPYVVKTPQINSPHVRDFQRRMIQRGWHKVPEHTPYSRHAGRPFTDDGQYGADTAAVVWAFQDEKGLMVDGKLGPVTWLQASRTDNVTHGS